MSRVPVPLNIHRGEREVVIKWADNQSSTFAARDLRLACQCAMCVDEISGAPLLDPDSVPDDIRPVAISLVGNYAIKIDWSDGHSTGIYTYDRLYSMARE